MTIDHNILKSALVHPMKHQLREVEVSKLSNSARARNNGA